MIQIYAAETSAHYSNEILNHLRTLMPPMTVGKLDKFKKWEDYQAHLLGRYLLRKNLIELGYAEDCLWHLKYSRYGRPFLNEEVDFSISHSGRMVMCAAGTGLRLGLDIEHKALVDLEDYKIMFSNIEWNSIQHNSNRNDRFYELWTRKEAFIKAEGSGWSILEEQLSTYTEWPSRSESGWFETSLPFHKDYAGCLFTSRQLSHPVQIHFVDPAHSLL